MNEVSVKPWRRVTARELRRWAVAGSWRSEEPSSLRAACGISFARAAGEVFATVVDTKKARDEFAGVVMEEHGRRKCFSSICSCERVPCEHAVAVALALCAAVQERRTPPRMKREDRRVAELPRPELGIDYFDVPEEDGSWLHDEVQADGAEEER